MQVEKLTIIVPYRDRLTHKRKFLEHITKLLEKELITYTILFIEQYRYKPFNRGKLLNIGFLEAPKSDYYIFHDVDMLMKEGSYSFQPGVTHMATQCSQFNYTMPYPEYFGGVTMFDYESFSKINGFPNDYWGWGVEDDALRGRCIEEGIEVARTNNTFNSLPHNRIVSENLYVENTFKWAKDIETYKENGLNSCTYKIVSQIDLKYPNTKIITVNI